MKRKKICLILGVSSFVGANLAQALKDEFIIVGTYNSNVVQSDDFLSIKCDVTNSRLVNGIVALVKPDFVLYCLGVHEPLSESDVAHQKGLYNLIDGLESFHTKLIYISSHLVFSGSQRLKTVEDSPIPMSGVGKSFSSLEYYIQKSYLNYLIVRVPRLIGVSVDESKLSLWERVWRNQHEEKELKLDSNCKFGFVSCRRVATVVKNSLAESLLNKVIQVDSKDHMTELEFAEQIASCLNFKIRSTQTTSIYTQVGSRFAMESYYEPKRVSFEINEFFNKKQKLKIVT